MLRYPITPNGVITLSIDNDLTSNPENGVPFSSGVIKSFRRERAIRGMRH